MCCLHHLCPCHCHTAVCITCAPATAIRPAVAMTQVVALRRSCRQWRLPCWTSSTRSCGKCWGTTGVFIRVLPPSLSPSCEFVCYVCYTHHLVAHSTACLWCVGCWHVPEVHIPHYVHSGRLSASSTHSPTQWLCASSCLFYLLPGLPIHTSSAPPPSPVYTSPPSPHHCLCTPTCPVGADLWTRCARRCGMHPEASAHT